MLREVVLEGLSKPGQCPSRSSVKIQMPRASGVSSWSCCSYGYIGDKMQRVAISGCIRCYEVLDRYEEDSRNGRLNMENSVHLMRTEGICRSDLTATIELQEVSQSANQSEVW